MLAVITSLLATVELMKATSESPGIQAFASPLVFGSLSFGIYRKWRIAAISGLVLFLIGPGYALVKVGGSPGAISLLAALAFLHGVRGTFAYHKLPPRPADLPSLAQSFDALGQYHPESDKSVAKPEPGLPPVA